MARLFACFLGDRRGSTADSETSDFSPSGFRDGSNQSQIVYVELLRHSNQPLGLVLEGGTDQDMPVQVALLRPGGVADKSGALQIGDHILSINGTVTDRLTNFEASSLLENAGNVVNLELAFDAPPEDVPKLDDGMELKTASITLPYEETNGCGFVISGGRLENRPITISHVKPGSIPYKKGILRAGDRILQINGHDMRNASQTSFTNLLKECSVSFVLQIEFDQTLHEGLEETNGPLMVELQKPHGASLGISLSGDRSAGEPIWISNVREAGIADRSGALHVGDHLLSINGQQLDNQTVEDARRLLAHSSINVILEITPSHNFSERPGISPVEDAVSDTSSRVSHSASVVEHERKVSQLSLTSLVSNQHLRSHPETMIIELVADVIGFGMGLGGGATEYGNLPVVISHIEPDGPAGVLGQLQVGDRVLAINGERLLDVTTHQAYKLVQEGGDTVTMEIEFDVTDAVIPSSGTYHVNLMKTGCLDLGISIRGHNEKMWIADLKKGGIAYRIGSLKPGDILLAVNDHNLVNKTPFDAVDMLKNSGDMVTLTVRRERLSTFVSSSKSSYSKSDDVIYSVQLNRLGQTLGIGLHGSERTGQPIVISAIMEGGVAHRTQALQVGDRILAINGESLLNKSIDDAARLLKSAGNVVTLKISKGVVSRRGRPRTRPGGTSARNYKQSKYRLNRPMNHYPSRVPSRISRTSESDLSLCEYITDPIIEKPLPYRRGEPGRRSTRYTPIDPSQPGIGRHSPSRQRYSPVGIKGRNSPGKDRVSPSRDRSNSSKSGLPLNELSSLRLNKRGSFTETTDEETVYDEEIFRHRRNQNGYQSNLSHYSDIDNPQTDSRVKELEDTLLRSKKFVDKLTELANHSGSSDPDSDSEHLRERLHPHVLQYVRSMKTPVEMVDLTLLRSSQSAGFGLSLSDGLLDGIYVNQIQPGGPAAQGGLLPFDKIMKFDDTEVVDYDCCKITPLFIEAGDQISLTVARNSFALNNGTVARSSVSPTGREEVNNFEQGLD